MENKVFQFTRLYALVVKEFFQIVRDPSSILISLVLPSILLFLFGFGVSLTPTHLKIGLLLEDHSSEAESFAFALVRSPSFDVVLYQNHTELMEKMIGDRIRGFVVVPSYFSSFFKNPNQSGPIQIVTDGSEPNTAKLLQNYIQGTLQLWSTERGYEMGNLVKPQIQLIPRFWYNPNMDTRNSLLPGSLATILTIVGSLLTALVVAREWERGTMESLITTPMSILEFVLSKMIVYFLLGLLAALFALAITILLFKVPFQGAFLAYLLLSSAFVFSALSIGLFISSNFKSQLLAYQIVMVTSFLPSYMLSGFIFEINNMPVIPRWVSTILPARYFTSALKTLFLVGDIWHLLLLDLLPMLGVGTLFFLFTMRKLKKRLE